MEAIEYNNRVDTVAKKLIDQFDYLSTPADVADDYVGRTAYAVDRMSLGIDKYMDDFPDTKLDIAFSFKQGTIDTPTFMSDVANRLQGVLLEQEYAPVDAQDIDNIVKNTFGRRLSVAGPFEIWEQIGWDLVEKILFQNQSNQKSILFLPTHHMFLILVMRLLK